MRDEILALLEERPLSLSDLAVVLQRPRKALRGLLHDLSADGCVRFIGHRKTGRWTLNRQAAGPAQTPVPPGLAALGPRERVIGGQVFEVVFSGGESLIGDCPGMGSSLGGTTGVARPKRRGQD